MEHGVHNLPQRSKATVTDNMQQNFGRLVFAGLPCGRNFYPHPHPIPTENPVSIPTGSPYPQNPTIMSTDTCLN